MQRKLAEFDSNARVQDLYQLFAFGLRSRQYMINRIHLKEFVAASQILKTSFRKVLHLWREKKRRSQELDEMFRLVQDFDKKEGY